MLPFQTKCEKLRPFGIRNLHGADEPHGILHISPPQYDSTLRSYPDAALTYVDEDDGETITVGSGLELEQRLEEPATRAGIRLGQFDSSCSCVPFNDQEIHLFNIKHTPENVRVWKHREGYSSRSLRERSVSPSGLSTAVGAHTDGPEPKQKNQSEGSSAALHPVFPTMKPLNTDLSNWTSRHQEEPIEERKALGAPSADPVESEASITLGFEAVEKPLGLFADLLDSTAGILRKTAQKTRAADSSPIETLLEGMKNIFTEVGQLGLEVLQAVEEDLIKTKLANNTTSLEKTSESSETKSVASQNPPAIQKRVSFADSRSENAATIDSQTEGKTAVPSPPQREKLLKLFDTRYGQSSANSSAATSGLPHISDLDLVGRVSLNDCTPKHASMASSTHAEPALRSLFSNGPGQQEPVIRQSSMTKSEQAKMQEKSIMDHDHANSDFLEKYPPLTSLRRAKTMESLNHPTKRPDWLCHKAALTRYPSISQLQSQDVSKAGEPAPYLAWKPPLLPTSKVKKATLPKLWTDCESFAVTGGVDAADDLVPEEQVRKVLPGAWPELKSEETGILPMMNYPIKPDPTVFIEDEEADVRPPRPVSPALSCRNTSPPLDPFFPASGVRRANTVTAANPAARLTMPFDPVTFDLSKGQMSKLSDRSHPDSQKIASETGPKRSQSLRNPIRYEPPRRTLNNEPPTLRTGFPASRPVPHVNAESTSGMNKGSQTRPPPSQPGAWPYPSVPKPSSQFPANRFPRPMRSEPNFTYPKPTPHRRGRGGQFPPPPSFTSKVDECVRSLRQMGYGKSNPNEAARLNVYAGAAAGDVIEAIEMIEDDRQAAEAMKLGAVRTL